MTQTLHPRVGDIVDYAHPVDKTTWPAMVLEVTDGAGAEADEPPGSGEVVCLLQVFRPRANDWVRAVEGLRDGTWKWPVRVLEVTAFGKGPKRIVARHIDSEGG